MVENLMILLFDLFLFTFYIVLGCGVALLIQGLVYQLSNKKINIYKKIINNKKIWNL